MGGSPLSHAKVIALFYILHFATAKRLQAEKCEESDVEWSDDWKTFRNTSAPQKEHDATEGYTLPNFVQVFTVRNISKDSPIIRREHVLELQRPIEKGVVQRARRYDKSDGNLYTLSDFTQYYGKAQGKAQWHAAMQAPQEWKNIRFGTGWSFSGDVFDKSMASWGFGFEGRESFIKGSPATYESIGLNMNEGDVNSWFMWDNLKDELLFTMYRQGKEWRIYAPQGEKPDGEILYIAKINGAMRKFGTSPRFKLQILDATTQKLAALYQPTFTLEEWTQLMISPSGRTSSPPVVQSAARDAPPLEEPDSQYLVVKAGVNGALLSALALVSHVLWLRDMARLEYGFDRKLKRLKALEEKEALQKKRPQATKKAVVEHEYTKEEIEANRQWALLPENVKRRMELEKQFKNAKRGYMTHKVKGGYLVKHQMTGAIHRIPGWTQKFETLHREAAMETKIIRPAGQKYIGPFKKLFRAGGLFGPSLHGYQKPKKKMKHFSAKKKKKS